MVSMGTSNGSSGGYVAPEKCPRITEVKTGLPLQAALQPGLVGTCQAGPLDSGSSRCSSKDQWTASPPSEAFDEWPMTQGRGYGAQAVCNPMNFGSAVRDGAPRPYTLNLAGNTINSGREANTGSHGHNQKEPAASQRNCQRRQKVPREDNVMDSKTTSMTMMLCNMPCRVGQQKVLDALKAKGFEGTYNFVYLPKGRSTHQGNIGYGFVDFKTMEDAERFQEAFEGFSFPGSLSEKRCTVKPASKQGYNALIKKYVHEDARLGSK